MELRTQYLLLLFVFGVIAKGLVKSTFGSNLSILLLACVGYYYWRTKQKEKCVYDDIARQQAEAAAKLDALHGVGDGRVTELSIAMRKTSFKLNEADTGVITDRIHQYSSKMAGSRKDRRKFLRKNSKTVKGVDINDPAQVAAFEAEKAAKAKAEVEATPNAGAGKKTNGKKTKKKNIETIVEEAVDATL